MSLAAFEFVESNAFVLDIGLNLDPRPVRDTKKGVYTGVHNRSQTIDEFRVKYPRIQFFCIDIFGCVFPFEANRFDVIFVGEVLSETDNPKIMFTEIARTLKPDGKIYFVLPARWRWSLTRLFGFPKEGRESNRFWTSAKIRDKIVGTGLIFERECAGGLGERIFRLRKGDMKE